MQLIGDVLDQRVVDRNGREMGRVDGIEAILIDGEPPQITAILIGPSALTDRLGARIAAWWRRLAARLAPALERPVRLPLSTVSVSDGTVRADAAIGESGSGRIERWARGVIRHIPGAGR